MNLKAIPLVLSAAASGVIGFVELVRIPLGARLTLVAIFNLVAIVTLATILAPHCLRRETGFTGLPGPATAQPKRVILSLLVLSLGFLAGILALGWTAAYHVITYGPATRRDSTMIVFTAGRPLAEQVVIQHPRRPALCRPFDLDPNRAAAVSQVDSEGPNPKLVIVNFQHPQATGLECLPVLHAADVKVFVQPPIIRALETAAIHTIRRYLWLGGLVLWFLTSGLFAVFCRPYSSD